MARIADDDSCDDGASEGAQGYDYGGYKQHSAARNVKDRVPRASVLRASQVPEHLARIAEDDSWDDGVSDEASSNKDVLPWGRVLISQVYVSGSLSGSELPVPSKVTILPVTTFWLSPASAVGATFG